MSTQPFRKLVPTLALTSKAASVRRANNHQPQHPESISLSSRNLLQCWHLLSLDAPTVAALWTWFIASANHIHLPLASTMSMAVAVWMLYALDRLMDARLIGTKQERECLEARHYFHYHYRKAFVALILVASIMIAILLPRLQPMAVHLYSELGALLAGYFIVVHASSAPHRLPKEIVVGFFFAAATFVPTIVRRPDLRPALLPFAVLFAVLCSLNCLFIHAWEHEERPARERSNPVTAFAIANLPLLATLLAVISTAIHGFAPRAPWALGLAIALAAAILLLLHARRKLIAPTTLRAAADLALTTPLILVPLLHR